MLKVGRHYLPRYQKTKKSSKAHTYNKLNHGGSSKYQRKDATIIAGVVQATRNKYNTIPQDNGTRMPNTDPTHGQ